MERRIYFTVLYRTTALRRKCLDAALYHPNAEIGLQREDDFHCHFKIWDCDQPGGLTHCMRYASGLTHCMSPIRSQLVPMAPTGTLWEDLMVFAVASICVLSDALMRKGEFKNALPSQSSLRKRPTSYSDVK